MMACKLCKHRGKEPKAVSWYYRNAYPEPQDQDLILQRAICNDCKLLLERLHTDTTIFAEIIK